MQRRDKKKVGGLGFGFEFSLARALIIYERILTSNAQRHGEPIYSGKFAVCFASGALPLFFFPLESYMPYL